jgi:hypothetical protein
MGEEAAMRTMIRIAALALTVMPTRVDAHPVAMDEQTRTLIESRIEEWPRELIARDQGEGPATQNRSSRMDSCSNPATRRISFPLSIMPGWPQR